MSCSIVIIYAVSNWFSHLGPRNQPLPVILPTKKIFKSQASLANENSNLPPYIFHRCSQQMVRDPLVLLYKRSFQKIQWPLWRLHCAVGWTGSQRTAASTRIKTCNFAGHLPMTWAEWWAKSNRQNTGEWRKWINHQQHGNPPLYLECYMITHCKLGLSPLVGHNLQL